MAVSLEIHNGIDSAREISVLHLHLPHITTGPLQMGRYGRNNDHRSRIWHCYTSHCGIEIEHHGFEEKSLIIEVVPLGS